MPSELLFFGVIAIVHDTCPRRRCNSIWSVNASPWTHLARTALWIWLYATGPAGLEPATPGFGGDSELGLCKGLWSPMRDALARRHAEITACHRVHEDGATPLTVRNQQERDMTAQSSCHLKLQ
jgi:hypothetical protein